MRCPSTRASVRAVALLVAVGGALSISGFHNRAAAQTTYVWNNASGTWDTTNPNWAVLGLPSSWVDGGSSVASFGGFLNAGRTITLADPRTASRLSFSSLGGSFYALGAGSLSLASAAGNDTIDVAAGTLGGTMFSAAGGNTVLSDIAFARDLEISNNGAFGLTSLTLAGAVNRATPGGSVLVSGSGNTVITGSIGASVTGGLSKSGAGTLHLAGSNAFTGGVGVSGGVLSFASDAALGDASNAITLSGGTIRSTTNTTLASGRVLNFVGSGRVDVASGTTLNVYGIAGSGVFTTTTSGGTPAGTLVLNAPSPTFTGQVRVGGPTVELVGHTLAQRNFAVGGNTALALGGSASLANASGVTVSNGAQLQINQTPSAIIGRLGSVPLTFNSGRFQYNTSANNSLPIVENFGPITATGTMLITSTSTAGPGVGALGTTLNFPSITLSDHATVAFRAINVNSQATFGAHYNQYFIGGVPFSTGNGTRSRTIVPWAALTNSSLTTSATWSALATFMTYDSALGFTPLNGTTEMMTVSSAGALAGVATGQNVRITGNNTQNILGGGQVINCFTNSGTTTITAASPSDVLTVTQGAIANIGTLTINNATVNAPGGAYIHLSNAVRVTGTSQLTGAGGVTTAALDGASASAIPQLQFSNVSGNSFTGGLYINGNSGVTFTQNNQLGNDDDRGAAAGNIVLGGGQLVLAVPGTVSLSDGDARPIRVNASNGAIGTNTATSVLQIPGTISGPGQLQFGGTLGSTVTGMVELTNPAANTYSGGTVVSQGVLRLSSTNQLGSGPILLNGGTVQASGNLNFATAPTLVVPSTIDTQGNTVTLAAGLGSSGGAAGTLALAQSLTKVGPGTLAINGASTGGALVLSGGTTLINGDYTAVSSGVPITVNTGSTLGGSGVASLSTSGIANTLRVLSGGTLSPGSGPGTFTVNGDLSLAAGAALALDVLGSAPGTQHDVLAINGAVDLGSSSLLINLGYAPSASDRFFVLVNDGVDPIVGNFAGLAEGGLVPLGSFNGVHYFATISYLGNSAAGTTGGGNDVVLFNVVPAPGASALLGVVGVQLLTRRRRR